MVVECGRPLPLSVGTAFKQSPRLIPGCVAGSQRLPKALRQMPGFSYNAAAQIVFWVRRIGLGEGMGAGSRLNHSLEPDG